MKRVLFVATVTNHINTFHIPYLKWFKEQGYEVHVASKGEEKIEYCDKHFNIPFERFPLTPKNLKAHKELKRIIDDNKYEIIHCHTPVGGVITRLVAKKARKKYNTKVIYTAHGFHFYKGAPILNWIIYYPIEKVCARWTDCLITINKEDYELAKRKFNKVRNIEYVHGVGMNTKRLEKNLSQEEKEEVREKLKIKKDDIVFSYIAELNLNKNQMLLIKTMEELKKEKPNIKLILIGGGALKEEYQEYVKNNNLENIVILLGKRQDINELLSITDIYLASSKREGLPVNIMEAMYKGLPIIASDNRGHRELIENEVNGFVVKDKKEIEEKIKEILAKKEMSKKLAEQSKNKSEKYTINSMFEEMKKIYSKGI